MMSEAEVQEEIRDILRRLRPRKARARQLLPWPVREVKKARFGSANDGGYVLLDDFRNIDTAFSFGIENNAEWDLQIADKGITVYQFDPTVDAPCPDNSRMVFERKRITPEPQPEAETLVSLVKRHDRRKRRPNILLKTDIETDEWAVIDATPPETLCRFTQIVGEFHYLESLSDPGWRALIGRAVKKLTAEYFVAHVHANNYAAVTTIGDVMFPNVLELTLANRRLYAPADTDETFPGPLDKPCNPGALDIPLGPFRY